MKITIWRFAVTLLAGLWSLTVYATDRPATEKEASTAPAHAPMITDAWARATVPGQPVGGAYMKISSPIPVTLVHAETDVARQVQVHTMLMDKGVMKMREQPAINIPAGRTVELAPGSMHLMLLGLKQPLKAGDMISLKMTFVGANQSKTVSTVTLPVRPLGQ